MKWDKDQGSGKQKGQIEFEKALDDWWENYKLMPVIDEPGTIPCGLIIIIELFYLFPLAPFLIIRNISRIIK